MSGTTMNKEIKEQLSAMLDEGCSSLERSRILDQLSSEELRQTWDRYHLIGDVMRGEGTRLSAGGIADRVRAQLETEPAIISAPRPGNSAETHPFWLRPAAGAALAASVAVLAVLTVPQLMETEPGGSPIQVAKAPVPISTGSLGRPPPPATGTRWKDLVQPEVESRLNRYLVDHNEYASPGGMGVLPYATFVSYDSGRP